MATITKKIFSCDVCGNASDVQTRAFGFDGARYEIDLCPKDTNGLNEVVAGYASQARKVTARQGQRRNSHRPKVSRPGRQAAKVSGARTKSAGSKKEAATGRSQPQTVMAGPEQAATARRSQPEVMAAPKQAASNSKPQEVMAAPKQTATASRSQPQKAKAAPKRAAAGTSRSQPQKAKAVSKRAATASRSQPQKAQKAKAAPKRAATVGRSDPPEVMATPKQAATASRSEPQKAQKAKAAPKRAAKGSRSQPQKAKAAPNQAAKATKQAAKASGIQQEKGVYVYGILPADIEVASETQGVGEHPGPLGIVYSDGLAALISEVSLPARLGSPEDLRIYREILDSTAIEVPVVPLRFGTVFTGEGSVADELLAGRHDEFATALEQLEGRVQFLVRGRYVKEALKARREEDTRALQRVMEGISVASVVREPAHEREAVHVAFLVDVDDEREVEQVVEDLSREWEGRIELRLLGPMAAYDFVMTDSG